MRQQQVEDSINNPWKLLWLKLFGIRTSGPMALEISCDKQRPVQYIFDHLVAHAVKNLPQPQKQNSSRQHTQKKDPVPL